MDENKDKVQTIFLSNETASKVFESAKDNFLTKGYMNGYLDGSKSGYKNGFVSGGFFTGTIVLVILFLIGAAYSVISYLLNIFNKEDKPNGSESVQREQQCEQTE